MFGGNLGERRGEGLARDRWGRLSAKDSPLMQIAPCWPQSKDGSRTVMSPPWLGVMVIAQMPFSPGDCRLTDVTVPPSTWGAARTCV